MHIPKGVKNEVVEEIMKNIKCKGKHFNELIYLVRYDGTEYSEKGE